MPLHNINLFLNDNLVGSAKMVFETAEELHINYFRIRLYDVVLVPYQVAGELTYFNPLQYLRGSELANKQPSPFRIEGLSELGDRVTLDRRFLLSFIGDSKERYRFAMMEFQLYRANVRDVEPDGLDTDGSVDDEEENSRILDSAENSRPPVGLSLHIGINTIDSNHYASAGLAAPGLDGCENDALAMQAIFEREGYQSTLLLSAQATREAVSEAIQKAAQTLKAGDIFVLTYSGHGFYLPELESDLLHHDEDDNRDETWVLYNGMIIDDELYELWGLFEEGVRVVVLSDSCNSGTVTRNLNLLDEDLNERSQIMQNIGAKSRLLDRHIGQRTINNNRDFYAQLRENLASRKVPLLRATVRLISGCQDDQQSYETGPPYRGLFSSVFETVWDKGAFEGTYDHLVQAIIGLGSELQWAQLPNHTLIGPKLSFFEQEKAFLIRSKAAEALASLQAIIEQKEPMTLVPAEKESPNQIEEEELLETIDRPPIGRSVHVGLDRVDPEKYSGWNGQLHGAESDADLLYRTFTVFPAQKRNTFSGELLMGNQATRQAFIEAIKSAAETLVNGDVFVLTFAGYGGHLPDITKEEQSGYSQTWCLYDGQLLDKELYECWTWFRKGVRILVLSDSSNHEHYIHQLNKQNPAFISQNYRSRSMPKDIATRVYLQNESFYDEIVKTVRSRGKSSIAANIKMMMANQNKQPAFEDSSGAGIFTSALFKAWDYGRFSGNYLDFFAAVKSMMPLQQQPLHFNYGPEKNSFDAETPFTIINTSSLSVPRSLDEHDTLLQTIALLAREGMANLLNYFGPDKLISLRQTSEAFKKLIDETAWGWLGTARYNENQIKYIGSTQIVYKAIPPENDKVAFDAFTNMMIRDWLYLDGINSISYSNLLFENEIRPEPPSSRNKFAINLLGLIASSTDSNLEVARQINYTQYLINNRRLISSAAHPEKANLVIKLNSPPKQTRKEWIEDEWWIWMPETIRN